MKEKEKEKDNLLLYGPASIEGHAHARFSIKYAEEVSEMADVFESADQCYLFIEKGMVRET